MAVLRAFQCWISLSSPSAQLEANGGKGLPDSRATGKKASRSLSRWRERYPESAVVDVACMRSKSVWAKPLIFRGCLFEKLMLIILTQVSNSFSVEANKEIQILNITGFHSL